MPGEGWHSMWWKLLVGGLALAAIYAPMMVSAARRARKKREKETEAQLPACDERGDGPDADHEAD